MWWPTCNYNTCTRDRRASFLILLMMGAGRPKHVEWLCRNKTCTVLHQVGVLFDLYYDARKHKSKMGPITCWRILEKRKILASADNQPQINQNISWFTKRWVPWCVLYTLSLGGEDRNNCVTCCIQAMGQTVWSSNHSRSKNLSLLQNVQIGLGAQPVFCGMCMWIFSRW